MSISIYTNENEINRRLTNTGKYLEPKDEFIISQNTKQQSSFGLCENDVIEFSVYDVSNNLLIQNNGESIRYIKYPDTLNYIKLTATDEIAVNVQLLLSEAGFTTGLLKANVNFVRQKAGDESAFRRLYIQEISATREEIRVVPLVVNGDEETTQQNLQELVDMQELNVDNTTYINHITNTLSQSETFIAQKARMYLNDVFPEVNSDYIEQVLKQDFGMQTGLDEFMVDIYKNIQELVNAELSSIQESSCETVSATALDAKMAGYILQSVNNAIVKLTLSGPQYSTNITGGIIERTEEEMFELGSSISTQGIAENTIEYTQTDLSNIKVSNKNIDNFANLQQQLIDRLNGEVSSTVTGGSTADTTTDTGTPTRSSTVPPSSTEDTTTTTTYGFSTSSTTTTTTLRGDRSTSFTTTTTTEGIIDGSSGTGRLG